MAYIPVHPNCLTDGQVPIFTSKGWVPISQIVVGDLVLTHKGRFKKVTNVIITKKQMPKVIKIWIKDGFVGLCRQKQLSLTDYHPLLTTSGWKSVGDLTTKDTLLFLASKCKRCGKPTPFYRPFCSWSCASSNTAQAMWEDGDRRDLLSAKISTSMKKQYKIGSRDKYLIGVSARKALKQKVIKQGFHHFQLPEVRENIRKATNLPKHNKANSERMTQNNPMKSEITRRKQSRSLKRFWFLHPEKHPNHTMGTIGRLTKPEKAMAVLLKRVGLLATSQFPIKTNQKIYFVDFAIPKLKVVIEVDGVFWHRGKKIFDLIRQTHIENEGWQVLRFTDKMINTKPKEVCLELKRITANHNGNFTFLPVGILKIEEVLLKKCKTLYNLTVDQDESFIAKGFVSHNCRCDWVPVVETIEYPRSFYSSVGLIPPPIERKPEEIQQVPQPKPVREFDSAGEEL